MSNDRLKNKLSKAQYNVTQQCGTEPPFTGEYYEHFETGIYYCVCCDEKLFDSSHKYDSGSGWPSFSDKIHSKSIKKIKDISLGISRIEIRCANCDAHLGHVFSDGPTQTGQRYCVNSLALKFKGKNK